MSIPRIEHPTFFIKIPSTQKDIKFRPMTVKEEKILLLAKESEETDIPDAICQILNNCAVEPLDLSKLAIFDVEYLFLKLRAQSVSNIVKVSYRDPDDEKVRDFEIDLNKIELKGSPVSSKTMLPIGQIEKQDASIELDWPSASLFQNADYKNASSTEVMDYMMAASIKAFHKGDTRISLENESREEVDEFINSLDLKTSETIKKFLMDLPSLYYEIKWVNENGNEQKVELNSLTDFFTF